jgi:hypothetical protein
MRLVGGSGDVLLDRAAWAGITRDPFAPLHKRIWGQHVALRFRFCYNSDKEDLP